MWQCAACDTRNEPEETSCVVCHAAPPSPDSAAARERIPDMPTFEAFPSPTRRARPGRTARPASPRPFFTTPATRRRRGMRPVLTIAAALLTVPVAIAGIAHFGPSASAGSTPSTVAATTASAEQQARALASLIQDSSRSRTAVKDAVIATKACRALSANAETFKSAAASRRSQRRQAAALSVSALPSGSDLAGTLVRALDYSAQADDAFAAWAGELAHGGCRPGKTATGNFTDGDRDSNSATAEKKRFVAGWNPIARTYDLTQFVYSDV
jgi:hypothetical protein